MLQLDHVCKSYTTNSFTQVALDNVSLAFRDNEFVSILGPSGSGKTTMLNVIGGLDHFDSGDLLIDGISTREYKDRDWDTYRNNRIGFVFQSYNLIPHQTILANVELALTLSGVSPAERRERAKQALTDVGLGDHVDKRPFQLSGGQMQRVAIARALINDPEILLADEPTGALDSRTSVQVMDLLHEVAQDRLVIMVTHNPELAREYSSRIVELADGKIRSDTDPFVPGPEDQREAKAARRTSMSFLTALSLSFNNLMTKKGRTLMTAFAGSIGIIGIAAILALANGVNAYIHEVEEDTLSVYPLQISSAGFDMTSLLVDMQGSDGSEGGGDGSGGGEDAADNLVRETRMVGSMFGSVGNNDLASLKSYLESGESDIDKYVQDIEYLYGVAPQIFDADTSAGVHQVNPDSSFAALGIGGSSSSLMSSSNAFSTNVFSALPADLTLVENQYDMKAGRWPTEKGELLLVLSRRGAVSDFVSYAMGLREHDELKTLVQRLADQEDFEAPTDTRTYTYDQIMDVEFKVVPAASMYQYEPDYQVWTSKKDDEAYVKSLVDAGQSLKIVGIVQPREDVDATSLGQGIYYTPALTYWLMDESAKAQVVQDQLANPSINVLTGKSFDQESKEEGSSFDMSSLFSVDEDKMAKALGLDGSSMDLSGADLSGLFGSMDLSSLGSGLDFSSMGSPQMDPSSLAEQLGLSGGTQGADLSSLASKLDFSNMAAPQMGLEDLAKELDFSNMAMPEMNMEELAKQMDFSSMEMPEMDLESLMKDMDLSNMELPEMDLSSMDLSNFDFSKIDLSQIELDLSKLDLSGIDLSDAVTPEMMEAVMGAIAKLDVPALFEGVDLSQAVDTSALMSALAQVQSGFEGYLAKNPVDPSDPQALAKAIRAYYQSPEVVEQLREAAQNSIKFSDADRETVVANLTQQLTEALGEEQVEEINAAAQKVLGELIGQLATQLGEQLFEQVMPQIMEVMAEGFATVLQSMLEQTMTTLLTTIGGAIQTQLQETMTTLLTGLGETLKTQLQDTMSGYMTTMSSTLQTQIEKAMTTYLTSMAGSIQAQLEQVMGEYMTSMASGMQKAFEETIKIYISNMASTLQTELQNTLTNTMTGAMSQLMTNMANSMHIDEQTFAEAFSFSMSEEELSELMMALMSTERSSYDNNLTKLGYASREKPSEIDIYPLSFEDKAEVINILDAYNERMAKEDEGKVITYTDLVGALMTSVTDIV
ncbi:MAG: ABC transporter ATP-binding protein, partial [Coriobacteriales bacterium]|nr:ABC transporter ATP-binding protein [Coriobacteriales bacterium]